MFSFFLWKEIGAGHAAFTYFCDKDEHLTIGKRERITMEPKELDVSPFYVTWKKGTENDGGLFILFYFFRDSKGGRERGTLM